MQKNMYSVYVELDEIKAFKLRTEYNSKEELSDKLDESKLSSSARSRRQV
ncbi:hypothetical protein RchiOBHm_Chr6g0261381 [Rosa chinensis]|uniref:Uncharacterized protein n=1 Tax=Rosa chinensis TaxID=74649 RepID=A0A2P6PNE6_ROSCH|nr:hypothetical protein RchiOBHm_Chr6g0261381 [Rosa chinensis]